MSGRRNVSLYVSMLEHSGEGDFTWMNKNPVMTIKLPQWRIQTLNRIFRFANSFGSQNYAQVFIRRSSNGISYKLLNKNSKDEWRWNIATQKRKVCNVEIEIVNDKKMFRNGLKIGEMHAFMHFNFDENGTTPGNPSKQNRERTKGYSRWKVE